MSVRVLVWMWASELVLCDQLPRDDSILYGDHLGLVIFFKQGVVCPENHTHGPSQLKEGQNINSGWAEIDILERHRDACRRFSRQRASVVNQ